MENKEKQLMYNSDIKELFLQEKNESSKQSYKRIFIYSAEYEEVFEKDLFDFNAVELKTFLGELVDKSKPKTPNSAHSIKSIINTYVLWAIENELKANEFNQITNLPPKWFEQFMNQDIQLYYPANIFMRIEDQCNNNQDAVIIRMLFEGIQGNGCSEIVNLRKKDYDYETHVVKLRDDDDDLRELTVTDRCIEMIHKAAKQEAYLLRNGEVDTESRRQEAELVDNEYVIRNSNTHLLPERLYEPADKHTIYRRLAVIKELIAEGLGVKLLTVKSISRSGMIYKGYQLFDERKRFGKEEVEEIAKQFKMGSLSTVKETVLDNVENLYGIKIEYYTDGEEE